VPRLTKSDIEKALLSGVSVPWTDANGKAQSIQLGTPKQRRLFEYLLRSKVRDVKGLPQSFVDSIAAAATAADDPASEKIEITVNPSASGPWKMHAVKIDGFGGVNTWNGKTLELELDGESLLLEGPNGSGKSSLTAAIVWALTGERPRDQSEGRVDEAQPVFDASNANAGSWPPVAAYPPNIAGLKTPPHVVVEVIFVNSAGTFASARREFDGKQVTYTADSALQIPTILIEAGLLMPARMPQLRLDEGRGRLTEAVQKLTGLDELVELSTFIQGLVHKSRDYLAYKSAEFNAALTEFGKQIERARTALAPVSQSVPGFKPADTDDKDGEMAKFGKLLNDKAAELLATISGDLEKSLVLADPNVQKNIVVALDGAEKDLRSGLAGLSTWKAVKDIADVMPAAVRDDARAAIATAEHELAAATGYLEKQKTDTRYRLKAAGAQWHHEHRPGPIADCPLCDTALAANPGLRGELEELRSAGEVATRRFADNINAIMTALEKATPQSLRRLLNDVLPQTPCATIAEEFRAKFVTAERYVKLLVKFAALAGAAAVQIPDVELATQVAKSPTIPESENAVKRLNCLERMCALAEWYEANQVTWANWWSTCAPAGDTGEENLTSHLKRLSKSLDEAEPYRIGADAMRVAWGQGRTAATIQKEQKKRQEIADELAVLKNLGNLAEAQARTAISELSGRISAIHSETYIVDRLQFQNATLDKKTGLVVRGRLADDMRIDATLIANTSWLRAILWAFILALREEAVEQIGGDIFPFLLLDDPQQTFDSEHRGRWAEQIAKLQKATPGVQIVMTTHDESFYSFLPFVGVTGRKANIVSAGEELGHIGVLEGDRLDRLWAAAERAKTPEAARNYMKAVREYVEGVLRLMLRGVDPSIPTAVLGDCRQKITELNKADIEPWKQPAFNTLLTAIAKGSKEIKWIEEAHHTSIPLGMNEARDVYKHWHDRLRPAIERAFRIIRDHRALHGGLTALHAFPPFVTLPEGHKAKVREFKQPLLGTAAALTDGRAADGCVDLNIGESGTETIELSDHFVFRLLTPTLEPVAAPNDLLLVRDHAKATPLSLVVALHEHRLLARRLQLADNHSDVAVLTASAINPRLTAPPVIAKLSTLTLKKIVGVLYDGKGTSTGGETEIAECGGEAGFSSVITGVKGYVEVSGHSAEPLALDKQFLIIGSAISLRDAEKRLDGRPVLAEDSDGARYFKRLRIEANDVILESLEIGGRFAPIVLAKKPGLLRHLAKLWPVIGVLFEKPE